MAESGRRISNITDHMMVIGIALAAIYWLLDSFMAIFLQTDNFLEKLIGVELDNIWMRIIVLCLFAIFGSHAQYTLNQRRRMAEKIVKDAATRERFQRLLSPDLAEMVVSGELTVEKGGENRVATVMFVDIRGFTRLSENTDASSVLQMLNEYYERMVDIVFRYQGTVDKFIGDAMMVIWGAPISHPDDPQRAIRAALEMNRALEEYNAERKRKGLAPIAVGIGINTGNLVAGYIGSSRTMSYSVIGDTVNTAARLCDAARPGEIIISDQTRQAVGRGRFRLEAKEPINAKGKDQPIKAWRVVAVAEGGQDE